MDWFRDAHLLDLTPFYAYIAFNGAVLDSGFSLSLLANVDLQEEAPLSTL
jgi:hypothetical protein